MTAPLVSVVLLTWNPGELVDRAIASVAGQRGADVELVVVDNASTDGTAERLAGLSGDDGLDRVAGLVRNPTNEGYAAGMNRGVAATTGDLIVPLNCDAVLAPDFVTAAIDFLDPRPEVGIVAPHVVTLPRPVPSGPLSGTETEEAEWRFWRRPANRYGLDGGVVGLDRRGRVVCPLRADEGATSFKANGACPVLRRALVDDVAETFGVGPFDPVFDTYGEDVDLAYKAWSLGWQTRYAPSVRAGHVRSYASPVELADKRGRLRANLVAERYVNAARHLPSRRLPGHLAKSVGGDLALVARQLCRGDAEVVVDVGRAWGRSARLAPALAGFRRRHRTWERIDFARSVHLDAPAAPDMK